MKNNELQKIWKTVDLQVNQKSKEELNLLLSSKAKQIIGRFLSIIVLSIISSAGLIMWVIITSINRKEDIIYLMNNSMLGIITIFAFLSGIVSLHKLQNYKYNQSLKDWLEARIKLISKSFTSRFKNLYIFIFPLIYALITLSIHVYFEYKPYLEVLKTEESIFGLMVGTPIGLLVGYYVMRKIRKFQLINLEFLKDMHGRLSNSD